MARGSVIAIDGYSTVNQADGSVIKSLGSQSVRCDLDTSVNFFTLQQIQKVDPVPRDENGEPHRLCSRGHYSPRRAFNKDRTRRDGLDPYCRQCRHSMQQQAKTTAR